MFGIRAFFLFYCGFVVNQRKLVTAEGLSRSPFQSFRQASFIKHESRYLDVAKVGTTTAYSEIDCGLACLRAPLCFSFNSAVSKKHDEKLWCELLSSDKFNNSKEFKENKDSNHFSHLSPCSAEPCRNGATCMAIYKHDSYRCLCTSSYGGKHCEKVCNVTDGWNMFNDSCYKVFTNQKTWSEAEQHCEQFNATLVTIHTKDENAFLASIIPSGSPDLWIGATDNTTVEGTFLWVDGSSLEGYDNWRTDEPNDLDQNEDCVELVPPTSTWNDDICSKLQPFICKSCPITQP